MKGFRLLTLGKSNDNTFLPFAFILLSSANKENRLCAENGNIDKRTNRAELHKEAILKFPVTMLNLISKVVKCEIPASYVLFDS